MSRRPPSRDAGFGESGGREIRPHAGRSCRAGSPIREIQFQLRDRIEALTAAVRSTHHKPSPTQKRMTKLPYRLTGLLMVAITTGVFAQENWVSLFNGQNLDGFVA